MIRSHCRRPTRGFSLVELMVVVAITLVVAAVAIPEAVLARQNFKLRSTASGVSGLIQKARMLSVARNDFYPVLTSTTTPKYAFVDIDKSGTMNSSAENTSILMPVDVAFDTGTSHPDATSILGSLTAVTGLPKFNPRGLPCFDSSGVCNVDSSKMYIMYLRLDRSIGATGWAAVNITPAGRVQVWTWDGSKWE